MRTPIYCLRQLKNAEGMPLNDEVAKLKRALFRLRRESISSEMENSKQNFAMARIAV
jgi:ribosomal protein L29